LHVATAGALALIPARLPLTSCPSGERVGYGVSQMEKLEIRLFSHPMLAIPLLGAIVTVLLALPELILCLALGWPL